MINQTTQMYSDAIKIKVDQLKLNPKDTALRTTILKEQVSMTADQLGITKQQAGNVVKGYTAAYITAAGGNAQEIMDSLTTDEQTILNYNKNKPTLYGMDLVTANHVASYFAAGATFFGGLAIILGLVALFVGGPEAFAAVAGVESVVGFLSTLAGISTAEVGSLVTGAAGLSFLLATMLGAFAFVVPMYTKQMIDNGSIGPGLRITALKDAEAAKQQLSGTASVGPFTTSEFNNYAAGLEASGVTTINNPNESGPVAYSRPELSKLVKYVFGQAILTGKPFTSTKLIPQITPYLKNSGGNAVAATTVSTGVVATPTVQKVKVFTGTVASGTLGAAVDFTTRESDLIATVSELQDAAQNNLASFATSLPGKLSYDVKIVSSITGSDGIKRVGGSQQIVAGYTSKGVAKYKTVVNRFAVLDVFIITDTMARVRIKTITLGPTDAVKLQPTSNQLVAVASGINANLFTTNITDITGIQTAQPITVSAPVVPVGTVVNVTPPVPVATPTQGSQPSAPATTPAPTSSPAPTVAPTPAPAPSAPVVVATPAWKTATNLSEFYSAIGQNLPSLSERATLYASYGLGSASLYAGTAEQNTKLLQYLQSHR